MSSPDWPGYLAEFHHQHPGITEQVLRRARADDGDAYDWLAAAVPSDGLVIDLACGNAPLWTRMNGRAYLGVDASTGELCAGRRRGVPALARARMDALPLPDASTPAIACSMALHIVAPLEPALAEISRVLQPGGHLVATVAATGPLRVTDMPVIAGLLAALGRRLRYPNDKKLVDVAALLENAGLNLVGDESRRYHYPLRAKPDADLFLTSLYLPGLPPWRRQAARAYLRALAHAHASLPIPIRRIIAAKP